MKKETRGFFIHYPAVASQSLAGPPVLRGSEAGTELMIIKIFNWGGAGIARPPSRCAPPSGYSTALSLNLLFQRRENLFYIVSFIYLISSRAAQRPGSTAAAQRAAAEVRGPKGPGLINKEP